MGNVASSVKLTKRVVEQADLGRGRHCIWDSELKGFGVQVEVSGSKSYFVRYRLKGQGRAGRRRFVKIGRHGDLTADEARAQAKVMLGQVANGLDPAAVRDAQRQEIEQQRSAQTFQDIAELFLDEHVAVKRKPNTLAGYRALLSQHAFPELGRYLAIEVSRPMLANLHLAMRGKPHSANRVIAVIGSMYSFAAKRGMVPEGFNPARGIEKYREEGRERYLTSDELQRLGAALAAAETTGIPWQIDESNPKAKHVPKKWKDQRELLDPGAVAAIRLLLFTGARLREILNLQWRHVDLERGLLFLPDSKTGKKTVVLSGAATDVIAAQRAEEEKIAGRVQGYVIKGQNDGKPRADLKRPWAAIQRRAELEGVRLHDLRHTFASIGAGASLGLPVVGKLLGHSQPQTTARYAHLDVDPLRRAANVIGDQLVASVGARRSSLRD